METGTVYLVGAGPGAPELITVRGLEILRKADVVVYDRLVSPALLEEAPETAERIFVGKASGHHSLPQPEINALLIEHARRGRNVVRLKGGDPFVFGRGGEEAQALTEARIPFVIVPGVSSAIAVPESVGIPVTHRGVSSSFAVITGHEACKERSSVDWAQLATAVDTLVVLMGLTNLPRIAAELVRHGRPSATPVAVISSGTTETERIVTGTLDDIAAKAAALAPPVVIIVGEVVRFAKDLGSMEALAMTEVSAENGKSSSQRA